MVDSPFDPNDTDKTVHGYVPTYEWMAAEIGARARVCEVGVYYGGSLKFWRHLFPEGIIYGVDNNPEAVWPAGTRRIVSQQDDPNLPSIVGELYQEWDLIVDDASHKADMTEKTLNLLWPLVAPERFYVIEDCFPGVWSCDDLYDFTKGLVGWVYTRTDVESITYRDGMTILRKRK